MELAVINSKIAALRTAEGTAKALINELAVATCQRIHEHNDVTSANAFIVCLSPLNQKKVLAFFKEHGGHKIQEGVLTSRSKAYVEKGNKMDPYLAAKDKFDSFVASGLSFWQWAVASKVKGDKPVTIEEIAKKASKAREALADGLEKGVVSKIQAFEMITGGVFTQADMMMILQAMASADKAIAVAQA